MVSCYSSGPKANMKKLNWLLMSVILIALHFVMPGECYRKPTLPDNCTCVTSEGIYSLFWLQRTDGKPKFIGTGFEPHPYYYYSYNPCVPYTLTSRKGICKNVALCKYNEDTQPVYNDIGDQTDVQCDISDGKVALIYPVRFGPFASSESRVNLVCKNDPKAQNEFILENEDNLIFQLTSYCGCPNKCLPPNSTTPSQPGPLTSTTPSSEPETASSTSRTPSSPRSTDSNSYGVLKILLASLLGILVAVILLVCLWMRLSVIQRARLCQCCHCYEQNRDIDPVRGERNVFATEKSPLLSNDENDRAVEHEYPGVKGKLNEPVQEEDGDVKRETNSLEKTKEQL